MQTLPDFDGFADAEAKFFHNLARDQNRSWFHAHKHEYEEGYVAPMTALLEEVRAKIGRFFGDYEIGAPKIFRIYRDVRFSKDKSPYKTHIGGYLPLTHGANPRGDKMLPAPLYVQIGTETFVGAGSYELSPEQLLRFRNAILSEQSGKELIKLCAKLTKAGFSVESHDSLKTAPRGFDPAHPRAEWLKRKSLTVGFPKIPKELLVSPKLVDWLVKETKRVAPLIVWLADAVAGP